MASRGNPPQQQRPATRLYLITPRDFSGIAELLPQALSVADIAAVLLRLPEGDEASQTGPIKAVAPAVQERGVALLLEGHPELAVRTGADGSHLDGIEALKLALPHLKPDRITGCGRLASRHDAMVAGEAGADYVMFGEPELEPARLLDALAERVAWWAELFEVPCVGFAGSLDEVQVLAAAGADFVALGDCVFKDPRGLNPALAEAAHRLAVEMPA
jgi:thiamine-phosphate pyrophosphorylase